MGLGQDLNSGPGLAVSAEARGYNAISRGGWTMPLGQPENIPDPASVAGDLVLVWRSKRSYPSAPPLGLPVGA